MKVNGKSIGKAIVVIIFLTIFPLYSLPLLPPEFNNLITMQGGLDFKDLTNRTAILGLVFAILIVLRGSVEKTSIGGLVISSIWKTFFFVVVIFILSIGKVENMGLANVSTQSSSIQNMVVIDLRLFVVLVGGIVLLMIARSVSMYKENQNLKKVYD
jgi:hypothetical protein